MCWARAFWINTTDIEVDAVSSGLIIDLTVQTYGARAGEQGCRRHFGRSRAEEQAERPRTPVGEGTVASSNRLSQHHDLSSLSSVAICYIIIRGLPPTTRLIPVSLVMYSISPFVGTAAKVLFGQNGAPLSLAYLHDPRFSERRVMIY